MKIIATNLLAVPQAVWNQLALERILKEGYGKREVPKQCKVKLAHSELVICPAYAVWKGEEYCFYEAAFLGKSAKPVLVKDRMNNKGMGNEKGNRGLFQG